MLITLIAGGVLVHVDPSCPTAWRKQPHYGELLRWARDMQVGVLIATKCITLKSDGEEHVQHYSREFLERRPESVP